MPLTFSNARYAEVCVLRPEGRITNDVAPQFRAAVEALVADGSGARLVLDFGGLDYVSSGGLRVVASAVRQCRAAGGEMAVAALTQVVEEIFSISRFHQVVAVYPTVPAALAALSAAAAAEYAG